MNKQLKKNETKLHLDKNYNNFLSDIKDRLRTSQIRAALSANRELIKFYWELGSDIIKCQKQYQWGEKFLEQFSRDLRQNSPGMQGFSKRNLENMRKFALCYPRIEFAKQPVSQLPWGHIIRLMQMLGDTRIREWYAEQAIKK